MIVKRVPTRPIMAQKPGTSGLRKKTEVFMRSGYLENFVQSIFDTVGGLEGKFLVLGGDGRHFGREACQIIIRMAAANGARRILVGRGGFLSTPAASCVIRQRRADGGIILSASHNPGGPEGDFGVKYNASNGGPAPESLSQAFFERSQRIDRFLTASIGDIDLDRIGEDRLGGTIIEVADPVADYAALMERLFDFDAIQNLFASGFRMRFDAMNAITGPYASSILEGRIGAPPGTVVNATPLPDFGGLHPDPNLVHAKGLFDLMMSPGAPDFAAAADGDGDRNMIIGRGIFVPPSDSLAVLAANAHLAPGYAEGLKGIARSMPTSRAADRVAGHLGIPAHETPTGWKYFGNLLDAGLATICGEESFGTSSDHVREKDGMWAVLLWLNIIAARKAGVAGILHGHWRQHGRDYSARHDYEGLDSEDAEVLMDALRERLPVLPGTEVQGLSVSGANDFRYVDPVDGFVSERQGIQIHFRTGERAVCRLSGTGTEGATLRVYLERPEPDATRHQLDSQSALADVALAVNELAGIRERTGRPGPDIRT